MIAQPLYPPAFQIGTRPVPTGAQWLMTGGETEAHIADKRRIIASESVSRYFMARKDTHDAQLEVADYVLGQLSRKTLAIEPGTDSPLLATGLIVAEDLVIMRRHHDGWRLVAAALFAPSYWTLAEKFDKPLQLIHDPVPGFGPGSRRAELINRMFDNLQPGIIMERRNWSFHAEGDWFTPVPHPHHLLSDDAPPDVLARMFVRREYQTLHKLPRSDDILFTIHVTTQSLEAARAHADEAVILAENIRALSTEEKAYKGLESGLNGLADFLDPRLHASN